MLRLIRATPDAFRVVVKPGEILYLKLKVIF